MGPAGLPIRVSEQSTDQVSEQCDERHNLCLVLDHPYFPSWDQRPDLIFLGAPMWFRQKGLAGDGGSEPHTDQFVLVGGTGTAEA